MKLCSVFLCLFSILVQQINGAASADASADVHWNELNQLEQRIRQLSEEDSKPSGNCRGVEHERLIRDIENATLLYREKGLIYWRRYRFDQRRYEWLRLSCMFSPGYYLDPIAADYSYRARKWEEIQVDQARYAQWMDLYQRELEPEYLKAKLSPDWKYGHLRLQFLNELQTQCSILAAQGRSDAFDLLANWIVASAEQFPGVTLFDRVAYRLFSAYDKWGATDEKAIKFAQSLATGKNPSLSSLGVGQLTTFGFKKTPLDLNGIGLDGKTVRLQDYRGKLVLLNFWGISCSVCFTEMKRLVPVYEKYRSRGFEVIGVNVDRLPGDTADSLKQALDRKLASLDQIGATWAQIGAYVGKPNSEDFPARFGLRWVPVTFIVAPDGTILSSTSTLGVDFDALISGHMKRLGMLN